VNRFRHPLFFIIVGLALLGFGFQLLVEPGKLFTQLLTWGIIIAIIFLVFRAVMRRRTNNEYSAYVRAAKKSKRKYNQQSITSVNRIQKGKKPTSTISHRKKRDSTHLTVIEGKKNKKKNRALF